MGLDQPARHGHRAASAQLMAHSAKTGEGVGEALAGDFLAVGEVSGGANPTIVFVSSRRTD
jgi:hypothetical protein